MNTQPYKPSTNDRKPAARASCRAVAASALVAAPPTNHVFSQGDPSAIAAAQLPAGKKKSNALTRHALKKAPRVNLSHTRLSKPSQPIRKHDVIDQEGFTVVTSSKRKASARDPSIQRCNGRAGRKSAPIPSFSVNVSPTIQQEEVTRRSSVHTATAKKMFFKVTNRKQQAQAILSNDHLDLTQSSEDEDVTSVAAESHNQVAVESPTLTPPAVASGADSPSDNDDFEEEKKSDDDGDALRARIRRNTDEVTSVLAENGMEEQRPSCNPDDCKTALALLRKNHKRNDGSLPSLNELRDSEELSVEEKTPLFKAMKAIHAQGKPAPRYFTMNDAVPTVIVQVPAAVAPVQVPTV